MRSPRACRHTLLAVNHARLSPAHKPDPISTSYFPARHSTPNGVNVFLFPFSMFHPSSPIATTFIIRTQWNIFGQALKFSFAKCFRLSYHPLRALFAPPGSKRFPGKLPSKWTVLCKYWHWRGATISAFVLLFFFVARWYRVCAN